MRVLLADDDPHVHSALRLLLEDEPGIALVASCATADGLLEQVISSRSDVALVDWDLPGLKDSQSVLLLRSQTCQVVALSGRPEERDEALRDGAGYFVCKGDTPHSLLLVLRALRLSGHCSE